MSLMDKVKEAALNQFIEVIEWLDDSQNTLVYRFPVAGQEIKNGAQLIVRESQAAVFVFVSPSTSAATMRPCGPEPLMLARSMPASPAKANCSAGSPTRTSPSCSTPASPPMARAIW